MSRSQEGKLSEVEYCVQRNGGIGQGRVRVWGGVGWGEIGLGCEGWGWLGGIG